MTPEQAADQLLRQMGSVGAVQVMPQYISGMPGVGAVQVMPQYLRGVGAPVEMIPAPAGSAVQYTQQSYAAGDVSYMGLGSTPILAGATAQITYRPNRPITPQRLGFASTVVGLLIKQVSIGGIGMFASEDGVPIELLSEVSEFPQMKWPTVDPSTGIVFTVLNPTLGSLDFKGAIYGTQVRI